MNENFPYSYFLNGRNPETNELIRMALQDIKNSGLSPEILELAQVKIFSGSPDELKKRLGFAHANGQSITRSHCLIEIPYLDIKGNVVRYEYKVIPPIQLRDGEQPRKYLQAKGQRPTPYILSSLWATKDKASKPLCITEGVKKVLKLLQHGRLAIGLSGVFNFHSGKNSHDEENRLLWADIASFKLSGRTIYIFYDSDMWVNPMVRLASYELAFTLHSRGAIVRFPFWQGPKGIDDYLSNKSNPEAALADLEDTSRDLKGQICVDHRNEILTAFYRATEPHGVNVNSQTLLAMVAKGLDLKTKELQKELEWLRRKDLQESAYIYLPPYLVNDEGQVCQRKPGRGNEEQYVVLSNFTAWIAEEITVDNGFGPPAKFFMIEGRTKDEDLPRVRVPASQFQKLEWVLGLWGNRPIIGPGAVIREALRVFIQQYSDYLGINHRIVYGHTGWLQSQEQWCYLMANGAIGADNVSVELPGEFLESGRYCLPRIPDNEREAFIAALLFLDIGKAEICFAALAYVFLSPLTCLLDPIPSFSLYFHGERDSFKTTVAVLMLAFFGKHSKIGLSNFDSTANSIMHRATILKDTLMIVDDYYPSPGQKEAMAKESVAQRIIRDVGNRTGRGRLNPDSSEKPIPTPKGMILITGEEIPGLQSTLSRIVAIEFSKGDIDPKRLAKVQQQAGLFPHAMSSFILWLRERIPSLQALLDSDIHRLRTTTSASSASKKIPEHEVYLRFAWSLFIDCATEKVGLRQAEKEEYLELGYESLAKVTNRHLLRLEHEDPVDMFFDIVGSLLTQGKLRIDRKEETNGGACLGSIAGELVGFYDDEWYYLLPTPLWHTVRSHLRIEGGHFPFSKSTLYSLLESRGHLDERGRNATHRVKGRSMKILKLRRGESDIFNQLGDDHGSPEQV